MSSQARFRSFALRGAFALVAVAAAVAFSPRLVRQAHAQVGEPTCTATCTNGSCAGNKPYCVCSCHWLWATPICKCVERVTTAPTM